MTEWKCEQTASTKAPRMLAWSFWTNMSNHEVEAGVERIELDGPFVTGTQGRTLESRV